MMFARNHWLKAIAANKFFRFSSTNDREAVKLSTIRDVVEMEIDSSRPNNANDNVDLTRVLVSSKRNVFVCLHDVLRLFLHLVIELLL